MYSRLEDQANVELTAYITIADRIDDEAIAIYDHLNIVYAIIGIYSKPIQQMPYLESLNIYVYYVNFPRSFSIVDNHIYLTSAAVNRNIVISSL